MVKGVLSSLSFTRYENRYVVSGIRRSPARSPSRKSFEREVEMIVSLRVLARGTIVRLIFPECSCLAVKRSHRSIGSSPTVRFVMLERRGDLVAKALRRARLYRCRVGFLFQLRWKARGDHILSRVNNDAGRSLSFGLNADGWCRGGRHCLTKRWTIGARWAFSTSARCPRKRLRSEDDSTVFLGSLYRVL